jgi:RNA polymerase sigma-70 factor (ECF subfamily)
MASTQILCASDEADAPQPGAASTERAEIVRAPRAATVAGMSASAPSTTDAELPKIQDLYREHFAFVWRTLRRLGVAPPSLDDAVQDVFLVVHRRLADFERGASPKPWLFGIAVRVAQQHRRSQWRQHRSLGFAEQVHGTEQLDPYRAAALAESAGTVQRFLAALDEDKRNVFILADLEQMSGQEIAHALNVNLNTVYARLRAARKLLISTLQRERARERRMDHE